MDVCVSVHHTLLEASISLAMSSDKLELGRGGDFNLEGVAREWLGSPLSMAPTSELLRLRIPITRATAPTGLDIVDDFFGVEGLTADAFD